MDIKKAVLQNKTLDVVSMSEFGRLIDNNAPFLRDVCVEIGDYVYPYKESPKSKRDVCITNFGPLITWQEPTTEEDKEAYSANNIVDLSPKNTKSLVDNIRAADKIKSLESTRLAKISNILTLPINEEDSEELVAIKQAINAKGIDSDSYKAKFPSESDFNNDMRALKSAANNNISFFKAKRVLNAFDIDMELIIKDKPDAVNPIGEEIRVSLTGEKD